MTSKYSAVQSIRVAIHATRTNECKPMRISILLTIIGLVVTLTASIHTAESFSGGAKSVYENQLSRIDGLVQEAIRERRLPGAVVLVGQHKSIDYLKAFGNRALLPAIEPMTIDTVFDLGSLTKVVATTPSIMLLVEQGRVDLDTPVSSYLSDFRGDDKSTVKVRDLLTHMSGLRPGLDLSDSWEGYNSAIRRAANGVPIVQPGKRFIYSDINFLLLGEIVRRVSGMPLDQFARIHLFEPLGMLDTKFNPAAELRSRIAPTERCAPGAKHCGGSKERVLRGVVHDPTARRMGGVAGHAGLFSTADDLAVYCRMLLNGGVHDKKQVLSPLTVKAMIMPWSPPGESAVRGLGWDLDMQYPNNGGELLAHRPFGHTGFTGTLLWLDPVTGLYVVFLSNRVHPDGRGDVKTLRTEVVKVAASALAYRPISSLLSGGKRAAEGQIPEPVHGTSPQRLPAVLTGIDVLEAEAFVPLQGKRVGLLTNHTGRARNGTRTIDLINRANNVQLVALFSPEHGIDGTLDEPVQSSLDNDTGLVIHSLYGKHRRPTAEMFEGMDTIVVDLQDIGTRFYTYATTMAYVMEEAAKREISVMVLDRPNPLNGEQIEGPILDPSQRGFTGYFPMVIRHGMTIGELALLFKGENHIDVDLKVVKLKGWRRKDWFDHTGLPWVNPSPNIRNLIQATLYPGIEAIEATNISVGRGTDTPFEQIGAPWIDGVRLAAALNARALPGVRFYPVSFIPTASNYSGEECKGVFLLVTDRLALQPVRLGLEIAATLYHLYPRAYPLEAAKSLLGSKNGLARIKAGERPAQVATSWAVDEAKWRELRKPYLLY